MLVTAFEPFGSDKINSSENVLAAVAQDFTDSEQCISTLILPVEFETATNLLIEAIDEIQPAYVICLGQANDRSEITIEKVAVNYAQFSIPDNSGAQPFDEPVVVDGPAAYFSTLPINALVKSINQTGTRGRISFSAGVYVCNALFYGLMHYLDTARSPIRGGFIHLPPLPGQVTDDKGKCLDIDSQIAAVRSVINTMLQTD